MSNKVFQASDFSVDSGGHYGSFGGQFAPEVLMPALEELEVAFREALKDDSFDKELRELHKTFIGRPTPFTHCKNLSYKLGGAQIFLKNEGSCLTGAHKINHCVGQILLAKRMGKKRIIAETGAGQHGVATATVCARFGFECIVYMGAIDADRQRPNVFFMEQLGAEVAPVHFGGKRLKDAVNAALKDWITNVGSSHYLLGSAVGPHPFPEINRYFQLVVGQEIRQQCLEATGGLPDYVIACVGGGSNAAGAFSEFLMEPSVELIGVEAGGKGAQIGEHAVRTKEKRVGVVEGYQSYWLLDKQGQVQNTHSISAGLDYAGIGPLHAHLADLGRVTYTSATDEETLHAVSTLAKTEGLISALESAHAVAEAMRLAPTLSKEKTIVVNLSGRGDKDLFILAKAMSNKKFFDFLKSYIKECP